ncbi:MAG: hypothetical protein AUJ52_04715 [Elusimicrobia bacterium CG1_02_63_36]|nr:MAG: hypothetical protein AUJ52_04715 [Elusimicrobia bacterium CG1_02_63_36]PIP83051.1 MAG: hypothetical protein COR54_11700 [Elusimicrobia bacterium CG22_combo_CG10-13_8_21_14_all_63_91]PJA14172.1 MAG: hypothetical protein COX66_13230 [Elusimicrobia bacterium CG_4_10_14_0_2_um_filter_63_34]PJB24432.1 MAG: hypothetical protein CO113_14000 [Elusimicrobia bacterium CG_4_9_14_3_um_filter_62_55]
MKNTLFAALTALVLSTSAYSAAPDSIESLRATAAAPVVSPFRRAFKASRFLSLSGWVTLRGNASVREGATFLSVPVSGNTTLYGSGARTGTVWINKTVMVRLYPGQTFVNETVPIYEYVPVYDGGRYVGSTNVSGSVRISGTLSGSWLQLSGSGNLSGTLFVNDRR